MRVRPGKDLGQNRLCLDSLHFSHLEEGLRSLFSNSWDGALEAKTLLVDGSTLFS